MSLDDRSVAVHRRNRISTAAVVIAVLAAAYLTVGLLLVLPTSGYTAVRLAFVALTVGVGWVGVVGAVVDRPPLLIAAGVVLLVLGFWQAVYWIFMLPAALGVAVAGVLLAHFP